MNSHCEFSRLIRIVSTGLLIIMSTYPVVAQTTTDIVGKGTLTRGKYWICSLPNGSMEKESSMYRIWQTNYPGHWMARNEATGGWDKTRIFNGARLDSVEVGWEWRNQRHEEHIYAIQQTEHTKNYNLENYLLPEESLKGVIGSYQFDGDGKRHMQYELEAETMVWSIPAYDDIVLIKCRLTNTDDVAFIDFYYARYVTPDGPYNPLGTNYDVEYMWDEEIGEEVGFIFYDDTEISPTAATDSTVYEESPGDVTGDKGDPGNIETQNSPDKKLYSPSLYAFTFYKDVLTPNKYGEKKVWMNIYSRSGSAPAEDNFPGSEILATYDGLVSALTANQPKMDWRDAHEQYDTGNRYGGSLYERNPQYVYGIGPYDIAPGESIEWVEVFIAGQMDRNVTILGGLDATTQFLEKGLENFKANWTAAKALIANGFVIPSDMPPPTPADAPDNSDFFSGKNFLVAEPSSSIVDGNEVAGVAMSWNAVHENYLDPITGEDDFYGYIIYRSNINVEGPWIPIDTLAVDEASFLIQNGKVTYFVQVEINIPYHYLVTSIDIDGNESGRTAYTHYSIAAKSFATNRMKMINVIPNPFRQYSGLSTVIDYKQLKFINLPEKCTIRIYTVALDLVRALEHDSGGEESWGTVQASDYMLTDFAMNVAPGVYIYHVESHVAGHEGDAHVGKFVIIR